jgi:phosphoglycerate dehydrogenase-like enzyme
MPRARLRVLTHVPVQLLTRVSKELPEVELVFVPMQGAPPESARGEVLLTHAAGAPNLAEVLARGVRWVHAYGTGVNAFPFQLLEGRPLTCSRGASAIPIAEWVLAMLLAAAKQLPETWVSEPPKHWSIAGLGGLYGHTLALVGLGGIAQAVALRALPFGMRVRALRRSQAPSPLPEVELARDLPDLVSGADHLVIAAPATVETRHLIDESVLARAKPGLHLVNIARGELVDQEALRKALDDGSVGRASLDVVYPEPLPAGHWLYTHPRVRLSPHISWSMPGAFELLIDPFLENLRRFQAGQPLEHLVDIERGY